MKTVTYEEVAEILDDILKNAAGVFVATDIVVGISRGGLFPAMIVATTMEKPLAVAYIDKQDNVYLDRAAWIRGKKVLLVDDVVRTGKTMDKTRKLLLSEGAVAVTTLAPYYLKSAERHAPDYGKVEPEDVAMPWDRCFLCE